MFKKLFQPIDISPLIIFRIFLGFLLFVECIGAILVGWVKNTFVSPKFTFSFIGMEWLQPLPGNGMYFYYLLMSFFGLLVMVGFKYRYSLAVFTMLWAGVYFMQKESYNNHYYLLFLICIIMLFLPAGKYASVDAERDPLIKQEYMPRWCSVVMILQVSIVYAFAVVSKLYPQWLDGSFIKLLLHNPNNPAYISGIFDKQWFHLTISWSGILFDLLIIPLLLWKPTRIIAFICSLIFHLFNAIVLQIGIFPFFALSFIVFFYPAAEIRQFFFRNKPAITITDSPNDRRSVFFYFFIPYLIIQIILLIRHYFIEGDVSWTEEGHRLSWRMMLRQKKGITTFRIVDNQTKKSSFYNLEENLTPKQRRFATSKPDGIWQLSQRIKKEYNNKGHDISIFVDAAISVNGGAYQIYVDPKTDFSKVRWNYFCHNEWIHPQTFKKTKP